MYMDLSKLLEELFGQLRMLYNNLFHSVCIKFYFPACLSMLHDNDLFQQPDYSLFGQ